MSVRSRFLVFIATLPWLGSCSQHPSAPASAMLEVRLATPARDDGAVLFTIAGGPVDSVDALGHALYTARIDQNTIRVVVAGDLEAGAIAWIHIADDRHISQYSITLNQVAARGYAQREVASYGLSLVR